MDEVDFRSSYVIKHHLMLVLLTWWLYIISAFLHVLIDLLAALCHKEVR